jgi:hypothetical protein
MGLIPWLESRQEANFLHTWAGKLEKGEKEEKEGGRVSLYQQ